VRQLLAHKQITTTVKFYAGAGSAAAFRQLDNLITRAREEDPADVYGSDEL
jgi:hypothetical protein